MDRNYLIYYYKDYREKVIARLSSYLDKKSFKNALKDHHSRRTPRPCGLTIHTGIGCPFQCIYCYIYGMGFPRKIERYPLSPLELTLSIALNKNVVLGPYGTFLAIGSVTEPFHRVVREYTISLIQYLNSFLGNPVQVSTKDILSDNQIDILKSIDKLSILYSLTSLKYYKILEPYASPPIERLSVINKLSLKGVHVTLFIRPIIPGIIEEEIDDILKVGLENNVRRIVFGTLRINSFILNEFKKHDFLYNSLKPYLPKKIDDKLRVLKTGNLKKILIRKALEYGYQVFPSACSASIDAAGQACGICNFGPCGDKNKLPYLDENMITEFLEYIGLRRFKVKLDDWLININVGEKRRLSQIEKYLSTVTRRKVYINSSSH